MLVHNYDDKLALGLSDYLDDFASSKKAHTWKNFENPNNWKSGVLDELNNSDIEILFNLDGIDNVWAAVTRAASGKGGATDWELLQIKQMPEIWDRVKWFLNGNPTVNPFG